MLDPTSSRAGMGGLSTELKRASTQHMEKNKNKMHEYWRRNVRIVLTLLGLWFVVSYGCGILLVDELNEFRLGGFKLGFWFAQQGSIYAFVLIIFLYVWLMNRLDREFDVDEE
jgi:putative solute:sodium symporter small subunit